ncbi:hypothetical protein V1514DRAFT_328311 [Lipomyces japonicus]|uniref:uncharacterized protein n=1 Tax=Lipomyces japonicus TaxID=56871 RepID=UPI0034CFCFCE
MSVDISTQAPSVLTSSLTTAQDDNDSRSDSNGRRRRSSWIHNFSSKLTPSPSPAHTEASLLNYPTKPSSSPTSSSSSFSSPQSSSPSKSGFFGALRRLSTSSRPGTQPQCVRVVYNKNQSRKECPLQELKSVNLKRVSFKVDDISDESLDKVSLYTQIRRAMKYQELLRERKQILAANPESVAGLDSRRSSAAVNRRCDEVAFLIASTSSSASSKRRISDSSASSTESSSTPSSSPSTSSTPQDLARIYARCCKLREVKPIQFFYDQFAGQFDSLDSVTVATPAGSDPPAFAQAQVLADFFSIIHVDHVNLDNVFLADELFKMLVSSLLVCKQVRSVSFKNAKIPFASWKAICYFVLMCPCVELIDFSGMSRKNSEWALLARAAVARNCKIKILLDNTNVSEQDMAAITAMASYSQA